MWDNSVGIAWLLMCTGGAFALYGFLAVSVWAGARRREREAYYRSEILKKIADAPQPGATSALELYREQERAAARRRREGLKLGGLVTVGVGVGMWVFLLQVASKDNAHMVALIPLFAGTMMLVYVFLLAPREKA